MLPMLLISNILDQLIQVPFFLRLMGEERNNDFLLSRKWCIIVCIIQDTFRVQNRVYCKVNECN